MLVTHRIGRLSLRIASAAAILIAVAGIPTGLIVFVGWPLPSAIPSTLDEAARLLTQPFDDAAVVKTLAAALWLLWASFCHALAVEVRTAARPDRSHCPTRWVTPQRALAAALVAGLAAGPSAAASAAVTSPAPVVAAPSAITALTHPLRPALTDLPGAETSAREQLAETKKEPHPASMRGRDAPRFAVRAHDGPITVVAADQRYTVTVKSGDTLWDIAETWLGDPHRWAEIFHLNRDRYDQHGRMRGGDHIEPRWVLTLPADATPPAADIRPKRPLTTAPSPPAPAPATTPSAEPRTAPGDDGVADPAQPPAAVTSPAATSAPATSTPTTRPPGTPPAPDRPAHQSPPGISLPTGGWIDLGLAAAVAAAAALVWRRRARRYHRRRPTPHLRTAEPHLARLPAVVSHIRRGLNRLEDDEPDDDPTTLSPAPNSSAVAAAADATGDPPSPAVPAPGTTFIDSWPAGGLGLTGPGAPAAARGFLASALASGNIDDPDARTTVVIPAPTLAALLCPATRHLPHTPRLTVTGSLAQALELVEEHTHHRTRLLFDLEVDSATQLPAANPAAEPVTPILLIADASAGHERARTAALLAQGQRLNIHGVLLGQWPHGDTVTVAENGTTTPGDLDTGRHGSHPKLQRLAVLTSDEALDLLATLAEAHTGAPQGHTALDEPPTQPATNVANPATTAPVPAADATDITDPGESPPGDDPDTSDAPAAGQAGHLHIQVLGRPQIIDMYDQEPLRHKARELLVYLTVRGGATQEQVLDDLMPSVPNRLAPHRLNTYVHNLRRLMRLTGGRATYIDRSNGTLRLNQQAVTVDLWQMQHALRQAQVTTDPQERRTALRAAVDAYHGPLADGHDYEWVEPYREAVRQQVLDAHLALADALTDQPDQALAVLETAISHNPYTEDPYVKAMQVHADLGQTEQIRILRRRLTRNLAEIDTEPTDATITLADRLITATQARPRPTDQAA
ncbi:BTAD domain-containing putative transcriptional regulator [Phytohabitans kaempferiae]|uniref:BTAD domain-containing putative transcriptional regulator n=1 Tax=Phytohabitans kaempferiae TaxID=1620943 RepID=A0ABV6M9H1_9ACTN